MSISTAVHHFSNSSEHVSGFAISDGSIILALTTLSVIAWLVAYYEIIRIGFKEKVAAIPMIAVVFNITWEFLLGLMTPVLPGLANLGLETAGTWGVRVEFLFDAVVLYTVILYGRHTFSIPRLRSEYPWVVALTLVIAVVGQYTFAIYYSDKHFLVVAYIDNMIMSIAFVVWFFMSVDGRGISHLVAWAKFIGTGAVSLAHLGFMQPWDSGSPIKAPENGHTYPALMLYLIMMSTIFDMAYVYLTRPKSMAKVFGNAAA